MSTNNLDETLCLLLRWRVWPTSFDHPVLHRMLAATSRGGGGGGGKSGCSKACNNSDGDGGGFSV